MLVLAMIAIGCSEECDECEECEECDDCDEAGGTGGKTSETGGKGGTGAKGGGGGAGGTSTSTETYTFKGILKDPVNADQLIEGITVKAVDNETGEDLGIEDETDSEGKFTLEGIKGKAVGVLAVGGKDADDTQRIDTYTFNLNSKATNYPIYNTSTDLAAMVEGAANIEYDEDVAAVTTGVYRIDSKGAGTPVSCATLTATDPETDEPVDGLTFYVAANRMPDTKGELKETGATGAVLVMAIKNPSKVKLTASVNGKELLSQTLPLFPNKAATGDMEQKRVTHYNRLYITSEDEVTPADCKSKQK